MNFNVNYEEQLGTIITFDLLLREEDILVINEMFTGKKIVYHAFGFTVNRKYTHSDIKKIFSANVFNVDEDRVYPEIISLSFGKFKNKPIVEIPTYYLEWLVASIDISEDIQKAVMLVLNERNKMVVV
jgi:hypothetical protein